MRSGAFGELIGGEPTAVGHGPVEAEAVSDEDGGAVQHGAEVGREPADELLETLGVDRSRGGLVVCVMSDISFFQSTLMAEMSSSRSMRSLSTRPPASSATFHVRPQSLRFSEPEPSMPTRSWP